MFAFFVWSVEKEALDLGKKKLIQEKKTSFFVNTWLISILKVFQRLENMELTLFDGLVVWISA